MKDKRILVVMGGVGSEREISLRTGGAVLRVLLAAGYDAEGFELDKGNLFMIGELKPELVFNAVHGKFGEDGNLQGFLDALGVPYTGSSLAASFIGYNKYYTKLLLERYGVPTPKYYIYGGEKPLFMPCVVKPVREGSTVGIAIVTEETEFEDAVKEALKYDNLVLVEEFIEGKELTVGVLNGEALPPIYIKPHSGFYDYKSKYTKGATDYLFDTGLNEKELASVRDAALSTYNSVGCKGAARVDIMFNKSPFVLEINTMPGLTETSLLPKAAEKGGLSFLELLERMMAEERIK